MTSVVFESQAPASRREEIMTAACAIFVAEGYHHTSMAAIAERIGVTKPILYRFFDSKLELYLAIVDAQNNELIQRVTDALQLPVEHERDRVRAAFSAYFTYIENKSEAFRLIFESDVTADEDIRLQVERASRECAKQIALTLQTVSPLADAQAELLGAALLGMAQVAARTRLRDPQGISSDEAIDLLTQLAWRGLSRLPVLD